MLMCFLLEGALDAYQNPSAGDRASGMVAAFVGVGGGCVQS